MSGLNALFGRFDDFVDAHARPGFAPTFEFDDSVFRSEDRVISALLGIISGINFGSALPVNNRTRGSELTISDLAAKTTSGRITAVTG